MAGSSSSKRSKHSVDSAKTCSGRPRKRRPTETEFDHELRLWLKSKKSRKTHLDTRVEAAQSDREIARGMGNTGRSAGIILTGCNYAGHWPIFRCPINNILYGSTTRVTKLRAVSRSARAASENIAGTPT